MPERKKCDDSGRRFRSVFMLSKLRYTALRAPYSIILFGVSSYISWRLFRLEYNSRMETIEGAFVGISRHLIEGWRDLGWWPAWYGGIPFHNSYPPLLHVLVALTSVTAGVQVARAHHMVTAFFFCVGPVLAYLMMARLSGRRLESFLGALLYAVFSPCSFLVPSITAEEGHPLNIRRLTTLVNWGEGPHIAGLALAPLAIYCLDIALEKRQALFYGAASLCFVSVVYMNWLAAIALAGLTLCYLVAGQPWRNWLITAVIGVGSYALASPWIPISLLRTISVNARTSGGDFSRTYQMLLWVGPAAIGAFAGLKFLLGLVRAPLYLQTIILFACLMASVGLGYCWFGYALLPEANRYMLESDFGMVFGAVMSAGLILEHGGYQWRRFAAAILFLFCLEQIYRAHVYARKSIHNIDITSTLEYKTARWFDGHMGGARVMAGGTTEFWMQAFTDAPQLCGGFEQGAENYITRIARYQILSGGGTRGDYVEIALLWLKAFGIAAIAAGGPETKEYYHSFAKGNEFKGALRELWREGDDAIYETPLRSRSLAHIMTPDQLVDRPPINGIDIEQLRRYVKALDTTKYPEAPFTWQSEHSATIVARLKPQEIVSVQITFDPGWRGEANSRPVHVFRDGLGLLAIRPSCTGDCGIRLVYDGGRERTLLRWLSSAVVSSWVIWLVAERWFSRRRRQE